MAQFEVVNELTLKVTFENGERVHTKAGAMIGFQGDLRFEKELLGPDNNRGIIGAALGQIGRRLSGENLPLMLVTPRSQSIGFFANEAQHVVCLNLQPGERVSVESENILAFTESCHYGVRFFGAGVISQKGLMTSTITGPGQVALLTDGNPIVLNGPCCVDPDAFVFYEGQENPQFKLQLSWKNIIGQASGESYFLQFNDPNTRVVIQPNERTSGIDIGIDGKGGKPTRQDNNLFRQDGNQMVGQIGQAMGGAFGGGTPQQGGGLGGALGGILGGMMGGGNNGF